MTTMTAQATQVYQVFIGATPEQIWEAITTPEFTTKYFHGSAVESTLEPGSPWNGYSADRSEHWVDGEVLEAEPPRRLQHTWRALYDPETALEPHSRVTWEIEPQDGGYCMLRVVHGSPFRASGKVAQTERVQMTRGCGVAVTVNAGVSV